MNARRKPRPTETHREKEERWRNLRLALRNPFDPMAHARMSHRAYIERAHCCEDPGVRAWALHCAGVWRKVLAAKKAQRRAVA